MHGFDNSGIEFDEDGIRNSLLSSPSTRRVFQEKMSCVSHQYSNAFRTEYSINGTSVVLKVIHYHLFSSSYSFPFNNVGLYKQKVDGELTLNENVADLGAVKAIIATLASMASQKGPEPNLPGLGKYTHEQVMLINAAQVFIHRF